MGLAASQGRYLCLTARNNDLVYEGQQISQQRIALAEKTQQIAEEYNEAINNKVMQATVYIDGQPVQQLLTYDLITNNDTFAGLGMRLVDNNGYVVVPGEFAEVTKKDGDKEPVTSKVFSASDFIDKYMSDIDEETRLSIGSSITNATEYFNNTYVQSHPDTTAGITVSARNAANNYGGLVQEGEHTLTDENCLDPKYIQRMLNSGDWLLEQGQYVSEGQYSYTSDVWQASNRIQEVYDTSDDAAAEAEYEAAMQELNKKDKILELRLEEVQTEQSAVEKEMESTKQVIDKNIEDSFKTFA